MLVNTTSIGVNHAEVRPALALQESTESPAQGNGIVDFNGTLLSIYGTDLIIVDPPEDVDLRNVIWYPHHLPEQPESDVLLLLDDGVGVDVDHDAADGLGGRDGQVQVLRLLEDVQRVRLVDGDLGHGAGHGHVDELAA